MKVTQIYSTLDTIVKEVLGETVVVNEDLSNVVEVGETLENMDLLDNYVKSLVDHIGRVVFVNRTYNGRGVTLLRDGWEYGSILEKISMKLPHATENESWELEDGASYDPNIFYKPTITAKFYNSKTTFEIPMSFAESRVKESFSNATQLGAFFSMIENAIRNSLTLQLEKLSMRTLNTLIAESVHADFSDADYSGVGGTHAINLLAKYKVLNPNANLTAESCLRDLDFLKFASAEIWKTVDNMKTYSTLFNVGGTEKFTDSDNMRIVLLSDFQRNADTYLQSSVFHDNYTALPENNRETVAYWQGSGTDFSFSQKSRIDVKTPNNNTVTLSGIIGTIFDRDACGVCNENQRVTSNYNPKAEFFSEWHKSDAQYFIDTNENAVVFFVA